MICTMAYRPFPKTRFLVEPPPVVLVAPDIFRLAIRELEITPEQGVSNKAKAAFNLHQARKAHTLLRGVDWSAFDRFWVEGGNEWDRRHDKAVHIEFQGPKARPVSAEVKRAGSETGRLDLSLLRTPCDHVGHDDSIGATATGGATDEPRKSTNPSDATPCALRPAGGPALCVREQHRVLMNAVSDRIHDTQHLVDRSATRQRARISAPC